jgi:hypothetical protein
MAAEGVDLTRERFPVLFPLTSAAQWVDEAALWRLDDSIRRVRRLAASRPAAAGTSREGGGNAWIATRPSLDWQADPSRLNGLPRFRLDSRDRIGLHDAAQRAHGCVDPTRRDLESMSIAQEDQPARPLTPRPPETVRRPARPHHLFLLAAILTVCGGTAAFWCLYEFRETSWPWAAAVSFASAQAALMVVLWSLGLASRESCP